ncbi:Amino acid permease [Citrus sinensis]|nr:Amino acid permease [Citrus sinensis]
MLPLVARPAETASYAFSHFEMSPDSTGVSSEPYAVILSVLLSNYNLYGYDTAAHLTEETQGADRTGPISILSTLVTLQDFGYRYDENNETAGALVPAQIFYEAFYGRFHDSAGAVVFLLFLLPTLYPITWNTFNYAPVDFGLVFTLICFGGSWMLGNGSTGQQGLLSLFKTLAITFSIVALFVGTPLYGQSLRYAGPATLIWGWVVVTFFTFFVGVALAEICSSFPTTGSLYFWAAHLAGPKWGPLASWCCAWLETVGSISGIGTQAYSGAQALQMIILLATGTHKNGGYFVPRGVFVAAYMSLAIIWAILNSFSLQVIAFLDIISFWWQVIGGGVVIVMLPLVARTTQPASYVFTHFETSPGSTGVSSIPYAVILSVLLSNFCLGGYDAAAHLTEETKGADRTGPVAILASIALISVFGWAYILSLTFSIQNFEYLYDENNETRGKLVPAQIFYDAFHGRFHNSAGAIVFLCIVWGSYFFCGLSVTAAAARVVYALSRDNGIPFSPIWRKLHPKYKVPRNAVWLCTAISMILGLPILKLDIIFTALISISAIGWIGAYAIPIYARLVMAEKNFKPGPFYLGKARRPICLIAFLWVLYTCSVFLLPTLYPITWNTFNYAPVALGLVFTLIMLWWYLDGRKWFKGPVRNIDTQNGIC